MWEKIFRRLHVSKGQLFFLLALWLVVGAVLMFWPAPSSIETLGIKHIVFFVPLFAAVLSTVHLFTHHPRRSMLIAVGVIGLAIMQLFRMISILNTFLFISTILLV